MSSFKTDTIKLKVFADDAAANASTPENDGGELAVVGADAGTATLKRYNGTRFFSMVSISTVQQCIQLV